MKGRRLLRNSVVILALQWVMTFATTAAALDRWPSLTELLGIFVATVMWIAVSILAARGVAMLRSRYVEWLTLDLA